MKYLKIEVQVWTVKDPEKGIEPEFVKTKEFTDLSDAKDYRDEKESSGFQATILGTKEEGTEIIKE